MRVQLVIRAVTCAALAASVLAVVVARTVSRPARFCVYSRAHHVVVPGLFFREGGGRTHVLDTETGTLTPLVLPEGDAVEWASVSDWVDHQGEREVIGRWIRREAGRGSRDLKDAGLGRFSFPSGRPVKRIPLQVLPASAACTHPSGGGRALFTTTDGRLFSVSLADEDGDTGETGSDTVRLVPWLNPPPALENPPIQNPAWIRHPRLGGHFLAEIGAVKDTRYAAPDGSSVRGFRQRLWWFRLSADGTRIADAGPLFSDGEGDGEHQCLPSLASLPDGGLALAYQHHNHVLHSADLRLLRVEVDALTGAPTARLAESRRVMERCASFPAAFSPDGTWLYALERASDGTMKGLSRHAVADVLSTSGDVALP